MDSDRKKTSFVFRQRGRFQSKIITGLPLFREAVGRERTGAAESDIAGQGPRFYPAGKPRATVDFSGMAARRQSGNPGASSVAPGAGPSKITVYDRSRNQKNHRMGAYHPGLSFSVLGCHDVLGLPRWHGPGCSRVLRSGSLGALPPGFLDRVDSGGSCWRGWVPDGPAKIMHADNPLKTDAGQLSGPMPAGTCCYLPPCPSCRHL